MYVFMGSQYRLEIDGEEFFIDLLLFHRRLRALVAIELKIGKFVPEFGCWRACEDGIRQAAPGATPSVTVRTLLQHLG